MTDREEFEKWWGVEPEERSLNMSLADNLTMYAWQAWQARGELDAVRIKELEEKLNDTKNYHIEWCSANVKIAELTSKLDKARDGDCCTEGCIKCDARKILAETQEPMIIKQENGMVLKLGYDELPNGTAFYTTPPSREWVGLSDWDYVEIYGHANLVDWRVVRAIEAKLREKNT